MTSFCAGVERSLESSLFALLEDVARIYPKVPFVCLAQLNHGFSRPSILTVIPLFQQNIQVTTHITLCQCVCSKDHVLLSAPRKQVLSEHNLDTGESHSSHGSDSQARRGRPSNNHLKLLFKTDKVQEHTGWLYPSYSELL